MLNDRSSLKKIHPLWLLLQYLLLIASAYLIGLLLLQEETGLDIFWNILIPATPAIIVIAPGLWRNICPLATLSLLPRLTGKSFQYSMNRKLTVQLTTLSIIVLLLILPFRHISLDTSGLSTSIMLMLAAILALSMGTLYKWRSGWCTTLCPIHPVERLYGLAPALSLSNARCNHCNRCTSPCPDSTPNMTPAVTAPSPSARLQGQLFIGGFAGYIWGWFQVPDFGGAISLSDTLSAYGWPLLGSMISLSIYFFFKHTLLKTKSEHIFLVKIFATAAVTIYYWYRIPALMGFGPHYGTGMLYDLTDTLPQVTEQLSHAATSLFFIWFLLLRSDNGHRWLIRPALLPSITRK